MFVNTVISLPASVITTCEPVVSATFVLVLTITVVIVTWQRRVIVIKKKIKKTLTLSNIIDNFGADMSAMLNLIVLTDHLMKVPMN